MKFLRIEQINNREAKGKQIKAALESRAVFFNLFQVAEPFQNY